MVIIDKFGVEQWMDDHETTAKYNVAETCCSSISIDQLRELSDTKDDTIVDQSARLDYGHIRGSPALLKNLSRLYSAKANSPLRDDHVLITPGAIAANYLALYTLIGPGDHVICHYPTYQQLYAVPASLGAEVSLWKAKPQKKWIPEIEELKNLIKENTKLIIINNPNNPTGAILPRALLDSIIELAAPKSITILSDEVYRPIFHSISPMSPDFPPSLISLPYPHTIVTGSLSKAYALAGIRVGWLASRDPTLIDACASTRQYLNISVSQLDQQVAAYALDPSCVHALLGRNIALARTNIALLDEFVQEYRRDCEWVKPVAGTTAFVRFELNRRPVDSVEMCKRLQEETGVMLLPGDYSFGSEWKGYVRFGYVCETAVLKEGLEELRKWMRRGFEAVPTLEED